MSSRTITLMSNGVHEECLIDTPVYPGMNLVPKDDGSGLFEPGKGIVGGSLPRVVKEDALRGLTVDDPYIPDDTIRTFYVIARKGDVNLLLLRAGQIVAEGQSLGPDDDGKWKIVDLGSAFFISLENVGPFGVDRLVAARCISGRSVVPFPLLGMIEWNDPSNINDLYKDSAGTLPVTDDYDPIGRHKDLSIADNDVFQNTTSDKPVYRLSQQNELPTTRFDGVDDHQTLAEPPEAENPDFRVDDFSIFMVIRRLTTGTDQILHTLHASAVVTRQSGTLFTFRNDGNLYIYTAVSGTTWAFTRSNGVSFPFGEFMLVEAIKIGSMVKLYKNGVELPVVNSGTHLANIYYDATIPKLTRIGSHPTVPATVLFPFHGDMGIRIVYDRGLSAVERSKVETEIITRWILPTGIKTLSTGDGDAILTGNLDEILVL